MPADEHKLIVPFATQQVCRLTGVVMPVFAKPAALLVSLGDKA
jgi:hypothetical protein